MHPGQGCWRWHLSFFKAAPSPLSCSSCWTVEEQTYLLPLHSLTPVGERVCSNLPACSSQHKGTCSSQFCATLLRAPGTHSLHCFQVKLKKPRGTRRLPLSVSWRDRIIPLGKLQLGTVNSGEKKTRLNVLCCVTTWMHCISISRHFPLLFQWPCLVFLVHTAGFKVWILWNLTSDGSNPGQSCCRIRAFALFEGWGVTFLSFKVKIFSKDSEDKPAHRVVVVSVSQLKSSCSRQG